MYCNLETTAGYIDSEFSDVEGGMKCESSPRFGGDVKYDDASPYKCDNYLENKNEFKWWCNEQNVEYSSVNTISDFTPLNVNKANDDISNVQTTDRTSTEQSESDDCNWHSIIVPNNEIEELRNQILYRLGVKLNKSNGHITTRRGNISTTSHPLTESSSNYISLKSRATPGDRGDVSETFYGSRGEVNKGADDRISSGKTLTGAVDGSTSCDSTPIYHYYNPEEQDTDLSYSKHNECKGDDTISSNQSTYNNTPHNMTSLSNGSRSIGVNTTVTCDHLDLIDTHVQWINGINLCLKDRLIDIINGHCNVEFTNSVEFIQSVQKHLIKVHEQLDQLTTENINNLPSSTDKSNVIVSQQSEVTSTNGPTSSSPLGVEPSSNYLPVNGRTTPGDRGEGNDQTSSGEPVADLREAKGEVNREADGRTSGGVMNSTSSVPSDGYYYRENKRLMEKLRVLQSSKDALEDDFKKTIVYMRLMKDRLKLFKDKSHVMNRSSTSNIDRSTSGILKNNVKFAEESDVYLMPKRSLSECQPLLVDKDKNKFSKFLDMSVDKIKQLFNGNTEEDNNNKEIALYKAHLISKGL